MYKPKTTFQSGVGYWYIPSDIIYQDEYDKLSDADKLNFVRIGDEKTLLPSDAGEGNNTAN